jgi:transaldolase
MIEENRMQIFLDTANIDQIKEAAKLGIVSGVTTNPSLLSKEATSDYETVARTICSIVSWPVSVEVLAEDARSMIAEARLKASWVPNVNIKIPITTDGLQATKALAEEKIKVNMTLCFSVNQALLGALAGATYVSVFVGRLDDAGHDGMQIVRDVLAVFKNYPHITTRVIAASIRHPLHCVEAAKAGAHIATVPYNVLVQMVQHPLTEVGIKRFLADWRKAAQK